MGVRLEQGVRRSGRKKQRPVSGDGEKGVELSEAPTTEAGWMWGGPRGLSEVSFSLTDSEKMVRTWNWFSGKTMIHFWTCWIEDAIRETRRRHPAGHCQCEIAASGTERWEQTPRRRSRRKETQSREVTEGKLELMRVRGQRMQVGLEEEEEEEDSSGTRAPGEGGRCAKAWNQKDSASALGPPS